jgi:hypothetical protein
MSFCLAQPSLRLSRWSTSSASRTTQDPSFRHSDVFGLSSRAEGFGIAMAGALRCGTPVISTGSGHGNLEDPCARSAWPPKDPAAMAAALSAAGEMHRRFPPESLKARAAEFRVRRLRRRLSVAVQQTRASVREDTGKRMNTPPAAVLGITALWCFRRGMPPP